MDSPLHDILFGEIPNDPARRSSVQLASEQPRPRRPMPRVMRLQAGPTRAQTTYGGQQGDVSRMHGFHTDEARDRWLHGSTFADRLRGGATLAAETLGLPSVMAEAEALGRRDWASAGQEAPAAAMTAVGPALGLFGRRAPVAPPRAAPEPVTRLPVNPTRIPTRASDGSVLPAREPQPFRRTEATSDDLRAAAAMRPRESGAGSGGGGATQLPPGALREIDDFYASVTLPGRGTHRLEDVLNHPALFAEFPELRGVEVRIGDLGEFAGGSTNGRTINLEPRFIGPEWGSDAKSTLLHEVQHIIDMAEGRVVQGATPDWITRNVARNGQFGPAREMYERLGTEQTAHATGRRANMTAAERAASDPFTNDPLAYRRVPWLRRMFGKEGRPYEFYPLERPRLAEITSGGPPRSNGGSALDASGQGRTGSPTQRLLPAIRDPATGEVFTDARGHAATFERIPMRDENTALSGTSLDDLADGSTNSGFVTPEGQFLTRPQAMEWAAQQEFGGGALQTRYDAARARWLEATNAGRADPALRAELDAAREALNAARRGPQRPPANPRPDSTLSGSAGGFPARAVEVAPGARLRISEQGDVSLSYRGNNWTDGYVGTGAEAQRVFRPTFRAIEQDALATGRPEYVLHAQSDRQRELYRAAFGRRAPENYRLVEDERGMRLVRSSATPDSSLFSSAGGFPIPQVIKRDFQRLAGGGPSPAPSQRALQGPGGRLTAMSRAGAPEMRAPGSAPSGLLQTPRGASQQSAIDPRVILGGGALGMFPTGAATAALVRQNAEENAVIDRMAALQRENKRRFEELRSRRGPRPYTNPGRLDMNRVVYPFDLEAPNYGYAISPATGRPLPAPK